MFSLQFLSKIPMPKAPKYPKTVVSTLPLHGVANVTPIKGTNSKKTTPFKDEKPMTSVAGGIANAKKEEKPVWNPPLAETITPHMPLPPKPEDLPVKTEEELEAIKNPLEHKSSTTSSGTPSYTTPSQAADDADFDYMAQFWGF